MPFVARGSTGAICASLVVVVHGHTGATFCTFVVDSMSSQACFLFSFLLLVCFFFSRWHSGSWNLAHCWPGSYLVGGTIFSHMVSVLLKGFQGQDTHAVRCCLQVKHALLHGAQARHIALIFRSWCQAEHILQANVRQTARPDTEYCIRHGACNKHMTL